MAEYISGAMGPRRIRSCRPFSKMGSRFPEMAPYRAAPLLAAALFLAGTTSPAAAEQQISDPVYQARCASCHGRSARGGFGPALTGQQFTAKWATAGVDALTKFIRETMPPAEPGSLSTDAYRRLAKVLLHANGIAVLETGEGPEAPSGPTKAQILSASSNEGGGLLPPVPNDDAPYRAALERRAALLRAVKPVTDDMLLNPPPADWLQWRRTYDGLGYSPLDRIDRTNAGQLQVAWSLALPSGTNGIIPLAHDGVLFVNSGGVVLALDAVSGSTLWAFNRPISAAPMSQPRGMALYDRFLLVPTIDNHMIALDIATGKVVWDHVIESSTGTLRFTGAPLVIRDKVIFGLSGCGGTSEPSGCFIAALDARSGREVWRFRTIARPGEAGGDSWNGAPAEERFGASIWSGGTFDTVNNLVLFGTGQTYRISPLLAKPTRPGTTNNALYTDTTLALDPDTGKLVWYYQHMGRDVWDMDWGFERQIVDLAGPSGSRRTVVTMGKLGILDMLDARSGKYLSSYDMGYQNLVTSIDPRTGRKTTDPALEPQDGHPITICPHATGVRNFPSTSYDPGAGILYVPFVRSCMDMIWAKGGDYEITGSTRAPEGADRDFGGLAAIDLQRRRPVWTIRQRAPSSASALATAGGIIFYGGRDRLFRVADSASGEMLWQLALDGVPSATPITFTAGGVQYVAVTTGGGSPNEATIRSLTPELASPGTGVRLWLFKLAGETP